MVRGSDGRRLNDGRREDGGDQGKGLGRFASTVAFCERAREPYGESFFAEVARTLGFGGGEWLLDLGTGPGLLALGFAPVALQEIVRQHFNIFNWLRLHETCEFA